MKIVVIDYGIGNVKSIINAFEKQNIKATLSRDKQVILEADGLILPGVGAFSHGMYNLNKYGLVPIIKEYVKKARVITNYEVVEDNDLPISRKNKSQGLTKDD